MAQLTACATWTQHGIKPSEDNRFRIEVLPIDVTAEIGNASEIVSHPPQLDDEKTFIDERMQDVANQLTTVLRSKLGESNVVELAPNVRLDLNKKELTADTPTPETIRELQKLRQTHNVQAVLTVSLAGYGALKQEWLTFLIGTGVAEGVVQGIVAAKVVSNPWVGLAVGLEEIGQELLEWGGGSYLFDSYYSPVTLEVRLVSTQDAATVYDDTVFVSVDKDAIKLLPEQDQHKRELQLLLTAKKAIAELVDEINKAAQSNIHHASNSDINY